MEIGVVEGKEDCIIHSIKDMETLEALKSLQNCIYAYKLLYRIYILKI